MNEISQKTLKRSQNLYIIEAALEYFVSILVAGSFLATLTKHLGFSDNLTGVLSSMISLGCLFQLLSLSLRRTRVKRFVIAFSIINQLLFTFLYVVPLTEFSKQTKTVLFVILIFAAFFIYNFAHPKKINWLMGLVDDKMRGSFTANKEIVSLASGIAFSFGMGAVIDHFSEIGKIKTAFSLAAAVLFTLMVLHSLTMIFTAEKDAEQKAHLSFKKTISELVKNKNVLKVTVVFILYYIANYVSTPFYGTYIIGELGLSLKFATAMAMVSSISRILVSRPLGRYADKNSFAKMIEKCFIFLAASQVCVIFAVPSTGKIAFVLYYLLHGIAMGGLNSALTNLIFDYVPYDKRADSIAVTQAFSGVVGFLTTLSVSPLVSFIQKSGNKILGIPMYAQQFVTIISLVFSVIAIIYIRRVLIKKQK